MAEIDPSEVDPYLKPTGPLGLITPPVGPGTEPKEIDPSEVDPYIAGPITSHDNPTVSRAKEPPDWYTYGVDAPTQLIAQVGGEAVGGLAGGAAGTVLEPGAGTAAGAAAGAEVGSGVANVGQAYASNVVKRALGYDPDAVDPGQKFKEGVESTAIGKYIVPGIIRWGGVPLAKKLFGVNRLEELGQDAVDAQSKAIDDQLMDVGKAHNKAQTVLDKAKQTAGEKVAADRIQQGLGYTAGQGASKLSSASTDTGRAALAVETNDTEQAAVKAANRSFERTGQQISGIWHQEGPNGETYAQTPVNVGHFTDTYDEIMGPPSGNKPPGSLSAPVAKLLDKMNTFGIGTNATAGDVLDMERDARLLAGKTKSPADQFALNRMRTQFEGILTDDNVMPPEIRDQLRPLNATYGKLKDWIPGQGFTSIKSSANPGDAFKRLIDLEPEGFQSVIQDATPEERATLRSGSAQYVAGRDPSDYKGIRDRLNKLYAYSPEGYRQLWAGTPMEDPRVMARIPQYSNEMRHALNNPRFQAYYAQGFSEAMNTPELKQLARELDKYHAMPDPESMRHDAILKGMETPAKQSGFWRYVQRRMMFDGVVTGMSGGQYGMMARHPLVSAGMATMMLPPYIRDRVMAEHPQAYWDFISKIGAGATPRAAREIGYAGARLMTLIAIDGMSKKAQAGKEAAGKTPERVVGVPATDPNAVAVP